MKFTCTVEINKPVEKVIQLFENPDNLKKWQEGFAGIEHISGSPGRPGAVSKLLYNTKRGVMELIETIRVNNLPHEMTALYEHKHMVNTMSNYFTSLGPEMTKYEVAVEYIKFNGFIPNIMSKLMPGVFKKQTQKWLESFKSFAENERN